MRTRDGRSCRRWLREREGKRIEVMTESFPELVRDMNPLIKETLWVMSRLNKCKSYLKLYCKTVENHRQREDLEVITETGYIT